MIALLKEHNGQVHVNMGIEDTKNDTVNIIFEDEQDYETVAIFDLNILRKEPNPRDQMALVCHPAKDAGTTKVIGVDYMIVPNNSELEKLSGKIGTWKDSVYEHEEIGGAHIFYIKGAKKYNQVLNNLSKKQKEINKSKN